MKFVKTLFILAVIFFFSFGAAGAEEKIKIGCWPAHRIRRGRRCQRQELRGPGRGEGEQGRRLARQKNRTGDLRRSGRRQGGVALAQKLIQQDKVVSLVAGSYSMPTRAVPPLFQDEGIPWWRLTQSTHVTKAGDFNYRNGFLGAVEGRAAAYTAVELMKAKKIALLTSDNDFGRTLAEASTSTSPSSPRARRKSSSPLPTRCPRRISNPTIENQGSGPGCDLFERLLLSDRAGAQAGARAGHEDPDHRRRGRRLAKTLEIAGDAAEGFVIVTNLNRDDQRPFVQEFLKDYETRFKIQPDMVGASAYDAS